MPNTTNTPAKNSNAALGWIALAVMPMFFSTNIIFGRAANSFDPFILASLRWTISATLLLIVIYPQWSIAKKLVVRHWKLMFLCGFLAMWICGAIVYLALQHTTATNGTLIYTTPPLMIIVMERVINGRKIRLREMIGIVVATLGIAVILTGGDLSKLAQMEFNRGDLMFLLAAASWAAYTLLLRTKPFDGVPTLVVFAVTAAFGSLTLIPFAIWEMSTTANFPTTSTGWQMVAGLVAFSSLIPFTLYQYGNRVHGSASASIFMYLLIPFGVGMAWMFLGEMPGLTIFVGCAFVLGGVIVATIPKRLLTFSKAK